MNEMIKILWRPDNGEWPQEPEATEEILYVMAACTDVILEAANEPGLTSFYRKIYDPNNNYAATVYLQNVPDIHQGKRNSGKRNIAIRRIANMTKSILLGDTATDNEVSAIVWDACYHSGICEKRPVNWLEVALPPVVPNVIKKAISEIQEDEDE